MKRIRKTLSPKLSVMKSSSQDMPALVVDNIMEPHDMFTNNLVATATAATLVSPFSVGDMNLATGELNKNIDQAIWTSTSPIQLQPPQALPYFDSGKLLLDVISLEFISCRSQTSILTHQNMVLFHEDALLDEQYNITFGDLNVNQSSHNNVPVPSSLALPKRLFHGDNMIQLEHKNCKFNN
jgi:hypothetical protein